MPIVGKKPKFQVGDIVRTVLGETGDRAVKTEVIARVCHVGMHYKRHEATYYLSARGRRHNRWYLAGQLKLVAAASQQPLFQPAWLAWRGGIITQMARVVAEENELSLLPILADALEDAGCDHSVLLANCRQANGPWVADLILNQVTEDAERRSAADQPRE
jgi:hypothetical protein